MTGRDAREMAAIRDAAIGAFLTVAFSDGQFAKAEEIRLKLGVLKSHASLHETASELDAAYERFVTAFSRDYDKAVASTLASLEKLKGHGMARRSVMAAAQSAVVADSAVKPQEELALERLAQALGLQRGAL